MLINVFRVTQVPNEDICYKTGGLHITIDEVIQWEHVPTGQEGSSCHHTAIIRYWWSHPMRTCSYMTGGVIVSPYRYHKVLMKSSNENMFLQDRRSSCHHTTTIRYWWSHPMRTCSYMIGGVIVSPYRYHKVLMKSSNENMFLQDRRGHRVTIPPS